MFLMGEQPMRLHVLVGGYFPMDFGGGHTSPWCRKLALAASRKRIVKGTLQGFFVLLASFAAIRFRKKAIVLLGAQR